MSSAKVYKTNLENNEAVENLIKKLRPDTIFHFSGQSSVSKSFEKPEETYASHYHTTKNLLDAIEKYSNSTRLFSAHLQSVLDLQKLDLMKIRLTTHKVHTQKQNLILLI